MKLKFIKALLDEKRFNISGAKQIINMYPCGLNRTCKGGITRNS